MDLPTTLSKIDSITGPVKKLLKYLFEKEPNVQLNLSNTTLSNSRIIIVMAQNNDKFIEPRNSENGLKLSIDPRRAGSDEKKKLLREIASELRDSGYTFLESSSKKLVEDIETEELKRKDILLFFKGKLTPEDYAALRVSFYLREKFENGESISEHKSALISKYGERGNNICNLCTTGYFESFIMPMYNEMESEPDFELENFRKVFSRVVTDFPLAYFVNRNQPQNQLNQLLLNKINNNKKYGIPYLRIHGIGWDNINLIEKAVCFLEDIRKAQVIEKEVKNKVITVVLRIFG